MLETKTEDVTGIVFIGNDTIGFVDAQQMCIDLNISKEEITEEIVMTYQQMCNGGQPIV